MPEGQLGYTRSIPIQKVVPGAWHTVETEFLPSSTFLQVASHWSQLEVARLPALWPQESPSTLDCTCLTL